MLAGITSSMQSMKSSSVSTKAVNILPRLEQLPLKQGMLVMVHLPFWFLTPVYGIAMGFLTTIITRHASLSVPKTLI